MAPVSEATPEQLVDTILFVDVDGVLNVGIYDRCDAPILLKCSELSLARDIVAMDYRGFDSATAYKICALAATPADREACTTFEALASQDQLSKVLVGRLAELIESAGSGCHVVLSSSWRKRQHTKRRHKLEEDLGASLGRSFSFDAFTQLTPELHAGDRVQVIRSYLQEFGQESRVAAELKIIVVDDFFLSPLSKVDPFVCGSHRLCCLDEAEDYLLEPLDALGIDASCKILHCYDEVVTNSGLVLQVGTGLSSDLLKEAKQFLLPPSESSESSPQKFERLGSGHFDGEEDEEWMEKSFFQLWATFA